MTVARILAALALAWLCAAPLSAAADPASDRVDLGAPPAQIDAQRARWQARFDAARRAVVDASVRQIEAMEAYRHMRHRDRERGQEKVDVMDELAAAEAELAAAKSAYDALVESARRAGVPPGWYPEREPAPAAPRGADGGE